MGHNKKKKPRITMASIIKDMHQLHQWLINIANVVRTHVAAISVLKEKGIITHAELEKKINDLFNKDTEFNTDQENSEGTGSIQSEGQSNIHQAPAGSGGCGIPDTESTGGVE